MINLEASLSTRSKSQSDVSFQQEHVTNAGFFSSFFPFYEELLQFSVVPNSIYLLFLIFYYFQSLAVSFWIPNSDFWTDSKFGSDFVHDYTSIFLFQPIDQDYFLVFIVLLVVTLIILLTFGFHLISNAITHRFFKSTLKPTRVIIELFTLVIMSPTCFLFGRSFEDIMDGNHSVKAICSCIFSLFMVAFTIFQFYTNYTLISSSPYLGINQLSSLSHNGFIFVGITNPLFYIASYVVSIFDRWIAILIMVVHLILMGYYIINVVQRPFTHQLTNILFLQLPSLLILNDLILVIARFVDFKASIFLIVELVLLILIAIGSVTFFHIQKKTINKKFALFDQLQSERDADPDATTGFFVDLKVTSSRYMAMLYLNFALAERSNVNYDFLLMKTILAHLHDTQTIMHCTKIISFFPMESRLLNYLTTAVSHSRDLNIGHKFLLYTLNHIRVIRQSSSSYAMATKLRDMHSKTIDINNQIVSFWECKNVNFRYLHDLHNNVSKTTSLWEELLQEYPNSAQISEAYCEYLSECATSFEKAILQEHRAEMINNGYNFSVDVSFKQFIGNYPDYLKKGYVDYRGAIIAGTLKNNQSSSSSQISKCTTNQFSSHNSSAFSLDDSMEESIGKQLLTNSRMRIALENATNAKSLHGSGLMKLMLGISVIICFGISLFLFLFFFSSFDDRVEVAERIELINRVQLNFYAADFCLMMNLATNLNLYNDQVLKQQIDKSDDQLESDGYVPEATWDQHKWPEQAMLMNLKARDYYSKFLVSMVALALDGTDIYGLAGPLFDTNGSQNFHCKKGEPLSPVTSDLQSSLSYNFIWQAVVSGNTDFNDWFTNYDPFCSLIKNSEVISTPIDHVKQLLLKSNTDEYEDSEHIIKMMLYIIPPAVFVIIFVLFLIAAINIYRKMVTLIELMQSFDPQVKHEAMQPIKKECDLEITVNPDDIEYKRQPTIVSVLVYALATALFVICIFIFLYVIVMECNKKFEYGNQWLISARSCMAIVIEIMTISLEEILVVNSATIPVQNITDNETLSDLLKQFSASLRLATDSITSKMGSVPAPFEYSDTVADLILNERCPTSTSQNDHALYCCASIEHSINILIDFLKDFLLRVETDYGGKIEQSTPLNIIHLVNRHLIPNLELLEDGFLDIIDDFDKSFKLQSAIMFIVLLLLSIVIVGILLMILEYYNCCFKAAMLLLRRVNPVAIVAKNELMDYLLDRKGQNDSQAMTTAQSVIHNSPDLILSISSNGVIETINPSVTNLLGYTPDQIIGQLFNVLFPEEDQQKIQSQMTLMKNKQSGTVYDDHVLTITDDDHTNPCMITILAMLGNDDSVKSFVFILCDEAELVKQQEEVEQAKKQSEALLFQILPPEIVLKINQGEKDISFSVPSSTIMFIDIVKFSEYASTLTPKEIMTNLSMIFGAYDESIQNYNLLLKIKLIGDVYMVAGGLFDHEIPPATHAEQMIKFAFDALNIIEETNIKLSAILKVRIGINTGGPLIAGVLGTDKPVFDIIGDPINIASRLQSTDIPGQVQISQDTANLVQNNDQFIIEQRGEIFLKGKGKTISYLVKPFKQSAFAIDTSST